MKKNKERLNMYLGMSPFLNLSGLGVDNWRTLYKREVTLESSLLGLHQMRKRLKRSSRIRRQIADKDGVMYVSLDGGGGDESCPSLADSSVVSLSQMAFLSMAVSIFSVVANIANNLNNNNNNQNDNNLNYVHQQNNNLNMNQNIVNQLTIDLPPPIPGKRSIPDDIISSPRQLEEPCQDQTLAKVAAALKDILSAGLTNGLESRGARDCLSRQLCLDYKRESGGSETGSFQQLLLTLGLAHIQLTDRGLPFTQFLESITESPDTFYAGSF
ncbi:cullin-4 [Eurytemora carolleeae]|uniref:cullin-4 n=1 Tax=Eurytemora carolleeae TaxID=1294199 RepID=UPI000C763D64|nr:cullin-4 [Eurytemora carolleeae]|eukprot:XP_023332069.1 cullin-4-like [Eurytemora affinis]